MREMPALMKVLFPSVRKYGMPFSGFPADSAKGSADTKNPACTGGPDFQAGKILCGTGQSAVPAKAFLRFSAAFAFLFDQRSFA